MRYVVIGLGAIGGTLAGLLQAAGSEVVGVARPGPHVDAIRTNGLLVQRHAGELRIDLDARAGLDRVGFRPDDVVILAVKSQDTAQLLRELCTTAPDSVELVCAQNGVSNEPEALRFFEHVHGAFVQCPALHLEPGVVVAYSSPIIGILDLGPYPSGRSEVADQVAADLRASGYSSVSIHDSARWKYAKLLTNLDNSVEVVCGPGQRTGRLSALLRAEARDVFERHAIAYASDGERHQRIDGTLTRHDVVGARPGGSVWQSVARGRHTEIDHLCGEIVRLARLVDCAAPANALMQRLTRGFAAHGPRVQMTEDDVLRALSGVPTRCEHPAQP